MFLAPVTTDGEGNGRPALPNAPAAAAADVEGPKSITKLLGVSNPAAAAAAGGAGGGIGGKPLPAAGTVSDNGCCCCCCCGASAGVAADGVFSAGGSICIGGAANGSATCKSSNI